MTVSYAAQEATDGHRTLQQTDRCGITFYVITSVRFVERLDFRGALWFTALRMNSTKVLDMTGKVYTKNNSLVHFRCASDVVGL